MKERHQAIPMEKNEGMTCDNRCIYINGTPWLTKPALLSRQNIKKSLFYIWLAQGRIISHQPFTGVAFYVYQMASSPEMEGAAI